jgi:hypothetical protein
VAGSGGPAGERLAGAQIRVGLAVALLLVLGAAVRALRFWSAMTWAHWDEANVAVPATQILAGTFPVHHVGVEYVGATAAYPLAVWFAVAGVSTTALDVFGYGVGLGVAWTGFLVARRVLPPRPALLSLAVLAAPPLLLAYWSIGGTLNPPLTLLVGNLILLVTHTVFFPPSGRSGPVPPRPAMTVLVVGLLAGVGWWTYPLGVVYWAPFAVLAVRTGLVRRGAFWLFPLGVALGGLPDWIYEALYYPTARLAVHASGAAPVQPIGARAAQLFGPIAMELFGASGMDGFVPPLGAQLAVMALGALVVARAVVRDAGELRWLAGGAGRPGPGLAVLWPLLAANVLAVLLSQRAIGSNYLLPLYSVLPVWTGECLWWLWTRRRWIGAGAAAGLLAFQLWSNWAVTLGRGPRVASRWDGLHATARPLTEWLTARGIPRVYWAAENLRSYEYSFLSGMRVVAAHLWGEEVVQHAHAVDADVAPPIVTQRNRLEELRSTLGGLSLALRETVVGGFVVIETRPTLAAGFAPLSPSAWTVMTSHRSHEAGHLVDRDAGTGWSSGTPQAPGQWLAVDLGREELVARIDLLAIDWQEVPAGFRVEHSRDGERWDEAVSVARYWGPFFRSERHAFLKIRRGRVQAIFEPARARHLRVVTTGASSYRPWAAREVFVYGPAPAAAMPPGEGEVAGVLHREGVRFVYANPWLSARVRVESGEGIGTLESNATVNSYGRSEPEPSVLERFRPRPDRAVLLGSDADAAGVRRLLGARGAIAREAMVGPYPLLVLAREAEPRRLSREGWRGSASRGTATAARAIDGDARTRWTAGGPVDSTASFTLELGRPRRLGGVRLVPGSREGGPADFLVEGTADGLTWRPIEPRTWAGPLYWTGSELLRNSRPEWGVAFAAVTLRALRIRPAAPAPIWTIAELTVME